MRGFVLAGATIVLCCSVAWAVTDTTVTITDKSGKPIPEATVSLARVDKKPAPKPKTAETDHAGKITVTHDEKDKDDKAIVIITVTTGGTTMTARTTLNALLTGGTIVVESRPTTTRPQTAEPRQTTLPQTSTPSGVQPRYSWSGVYVGGWAGGGWGRSSWSNPDDGALGTVNSSGVLLGGYGGYNWQSGIYVVGVEAGGAWANIHGSFEKFGWSFAGTVRGVEELTARFGVTTGPNSDMLWFLKAGGALSQYKLTSDWPEIGTHFEANKTLGGWTAGAGFEYRWSPTISYRLEYGYYNFSGGSADLTPDKGGVDPYHVNLGQTSVHTVSLGLNYYLNK